MTSLADILTTATRRQLEQIQRATGLNQHQFEHRDAPSSALWVKKAIAEALDQPVDEVFGPAGGQS